jgi:hypothetical protein
VPDENCFIVLVIRTGRFPNISQTHYYLRQLARYVNPLKHSGNYMYRQFNI